tara:strand:+ start:298 stop:459 length:162 start_codon:yes stop_codon:yes gene_type:complete
MLTLDTRNMACCAVAGQGAGIAAAISVVDNVPLNGVDMTKVQAELIAQGGRIA